MATIETGSEAFPPTRWADALLKLPAAIFAARPAAIGGTVLVLYVLLTLGMAYLKPQTDWDVLPYIALAVEHLYSTPAALHDFAYGLIKANVEPGDFVTLTQSGDYRIAMFTDPIGFASMFGMYRVKWLYIEGLSWLSTFMNPLQAIRLVSGIAAAAFGAVAFAWLRAGRALAAGPLLAGVLIVASFGTMAAADSPDMLFSALFLAGVFAYVRKIEWLTALLLILAFLVRPDNLLFLGVFAALLTLYRQWSWGVIVAFLVSAAAFFPLTASTGEPGWWTHIYFGAIEKQTNMTGFVAPFSPTLYLTVLVKEAFLAITIQTWVGVLLMTLVGWFVVARSDVRLPRREQLLGIALFLSIAAKFVLLPNYDSRFYFAYLIALCLILARPLLDLIGSRTELSAS